jgi:hypothetical protein
MSFSPLAWWTQDMAFHTFLYCQFLIGIPFFIFNTYVTCQLQVVGYLIGTDLDGGTLHDILHRPLGKGMARSQLDSVIYERPWFRAGRGPDDLLVGIL